MAKAKRKAKAKAKRKAKAKGPKPVEAITHTDKRANLPTGLPPPS